MIAWRAFRNMLLTAVGDRRGRHGSLSALPFGYKRLVLNLDIVMHFMRIMEVA